MPKFFVKQNQIEDKYINIIGQDVNHIKNVLRKQIDDNIKICNTDTGKNYICSINNINTDNIKCEILQEKDSMSEANLYINIFQGLPKADKMEFIIQKSTELGVKEITPVIMERCVSKVDAKTEKKKNERWNKIAEVAAKQSGRDMIPIINNTINLKNICNLIDDYDIVLLPYEKENVNMLKEELNKLKETFKRNLKIGIIIGPEGRI